MVPPGILVAISQTILCNQKGHNVVHKLINLADVSTVLCSFLELLSGTCIVGKVKELVLKHESKLGTYIT